MTPEVWARITELFGAALEKPAGERATYLRAACGGDESLRREVESLLAAGQVPSIESPAVKLLGAETGAVPELSTGQVLGRYRVEAKLGEGGMGEVYKAHDSVLRRTVALKVLPAWRFADAESRQRLVREARAASALDHPNIVTIYDVDQVGGIDFIAMEYVAGKALYQVIPRKGLRLDEALKYAIQITDALAAAHVAGIVHRDIKPSNILVSDEGRVKVLDFGLAKLTKPAPDASGLSAPTAEGLIQGTAAYMSPEQAQGKPVDARSDIFSFGAVLYEMLTGRRAFPGDSPIATMAAILNKEPAVLPAEVPRDLQNAIARCLRKDPPRRFQHMDDVKITLEELRDDPELVWAPQPVQGLPRGRQWIWIAAAFLVIWAATAVSWWRSAHPPQPPPPVLRQLTWDSGLTTDPTVSPDGKLLAYASDRSGEGHLDIWLQYLGVSGEEPRRLTNGPADDHEPCFSPDGTKIAFRSERDGGGIYVVSALGGDARLLVKGGRWPRYSPDGSRIAYGIGTAAFHYFVMPADGGEPWQISDLVGRAIIGTQSAGMAWSPDGIRLIVAGSRTVGESERYDWWVLLAAAGVSGPAVRVNMRPLTSMAVPGVGHGALPMAWLRDRVVFTAALGDQPDAHIGDKTNIWEVPFSARSFQIVGAPRRLTFGTENEWQAVLTGGARLIFATQPATLGLWELPVESNRGEVKGELRSLTSGAAGGRLPTLSADGKQLAFASSRLGNQNVWLKNLETGKEIALKRSSTNNPGPVISRDGSAIIYSPEDQGIYSISVAGGTPRRLCASCSVPTDWSTDRTKVLFQCFPNPTMTIGLLDLSTGAKQEILKHANVKGGVYRAHFSPDERWLVFHAYDPAGGTRDFIAPFSGPKPIPEREWIALTDGKSLSDAPRWSPDGNLIYYVSDRDGFQCIWAQCLDPQTKRPVGDPFAVQHFHQRQRSIGDVGAGSLDLAVAGGRLVFTMVERRGNVFMADFGQFLP